MNFFMKSCVCHYCSTVVLYSIPLDLLLVSESACYLLLFVFVICLIAGDLFFLLGNKNISHYNGASIWAPLDGHQKNLL